MILNSHVKTTEKSMNKVKKKQFIKRCPFGLKMINKKNAHN